MLLILLLENLDIILWLVKNLGRVIIKSYLFSYGKDDVEPEKLDELKELIEQKKDIKEIKKMLEEIKNK